MRLLIIFSCLIAFFLARWFILLRRSLQAAKKTGLPYICRPLYEGVFAYLLWMPILNCLIDYLSDWLAKILDPSDYAGIYRSWRFRAGYENHRVLGDVFLVVSPGLLVLEVADPHVCAQITGRRMDFVKDFDTYVTLRIFGRNIVETEGETRKRHRRAVTPQYTDAIHAFVWDQATIIGREMLSEWKHLEDANTPIQAPYTSRESRDLKTLANRVVMAAVFGVSLSLRTGKSPEAMALSEFARSMETINAGLIFVMIFPQLVMPYVPGIGHLSKAMNHVNLYMKNILDRHINAKNKPESSAKAGILDGLLKVLAPPGTVPTEDQLSRSDVAGNMFALALAGSTTSAETMHFSMVLFALYPKVQLWVMEELDQLAAEYGQPKDGWKYEDVFPKLVRLSCVMMETLRLFPAVPMIPKCVKDKPQILSHKNSTFALPPRTLIALSACALHRNPQVWGADAGEFRPERWLADDGKSLRPEPVEGSFVGFSRGTRRCLGRRFAESEYAAVLSDVLRNCRIELAPEKPGETVEEMSLNARKMLEMSKTDFTLHIGGRVSLRFVDRF